MTRFRRILSVLLGVVFVAASLHARAGVIATDEAQADGLDQERSRVREALARPEVARELEKFGIASAEAAKRVDAMSEAEVRMIAGRIDALPAGGALSNTDLIIILLLVILVAVVI